ncbi:GNAT family N-acetyltransferase, partial [Escherichia coli]
AISKLELVLDIYPSLSLILRYIYCLVFQGASSDPVWLGVWEYNPRAISFYRKLGFTEVGEHICQVGSDPQRDIIMKRSTYAS